MANLGDLAAIAQAQERLPAPTAVDEMEDDDDSSSMLSELEEGQDEEEEEEPQDEEMEDDEEEEEEEEQLALPSDEEPEIDEQVETEGPDLAEDEDQDEEVETQADEDNDTEAETERLEITPRKSHPRRAVLFNRNGSTVMVGSPLKNETPRKLIPRLGELQAPTSEMTTPNESEDDLSAVESTMSSPTRKRKRSIDSDLTPRRKTTRLESEVPEDESDAEARKILDEDDDDELSEGEDIQSPIASEDEVVVEAKEQATAEQSSLEDDVEEKEGLSEEESSKRAEMELNHKKKAMEQMSEIDSLFMKFRDDLFEYRMKLLDEQITILEEDEQSHPLYQEFKKIIIERRDKQKQRAQKLYDLEMHCLKVKSVAERAAAHSQYMQDARDARDKALEETSKEWYAIQKSRRDIENEEGARLGYYPANRSDIVNSAQSYNDEVSILWGIKKNVGFPAAPEILSLTPREIEEDLKKLGLSRTSQVRNAPTSNLQQIHPQQHFQPQHQQAQQQLMQNTISAEEQFLEQNPWANPRHPAHAWMQTRPPSPNTQNPTATPAHGMLQNNATPAVLGSASTIPLQSSQGPTPHQGTVEQYNVGPARMQVVMTDRFMETPSRVPTRQHTPLMSRQQSPSNMNGEGTRMYHQSGMQSPPTTNVEPLQNGVAGGLFRPSNAVNGTAGMNTGEGERSAEMAGPSIQV